MKPVPLESRTKNLTPPKYLRDRCRHCDDTGMTVVQTRPVIQTAWMREHGIRPADGAAIEEFGPCPFCEQGYAEEFPDQAKWSKSPGIVPPWGLSDGFWRGRDVA